MVQFGDRKVGDGAPVFVTYEAGPTHNGLESAMRLATLAAEAGADAIKFQVLDPDRLVADKSVMFHFSILEDKATGKQKSVSAPLYDLLKSRSLKREEWVKLKQHTDKVGIAFFATACFFDEIDFLAELGCHSFKIASSDVDHLPLIRHAARTGMCIQLDTGNSTIGEIETAIDAILAEGNENIIIHHCPSGYPAKLEGINLNIIKTLKQMFHFPVAFSDHSPGWDMDIAAVALGANLVEKTITEDRATPSVEHVFSLEPQDMKQFVTVIQNLEIALGSQRRMMTSVERTNRLMMRRSVHLAEDARAGQRVSELKVDYRRPGIGISPVDFEKYSDCIFTNDLKAGERLKSSHFMRQEQ